jgi:antitoxin component of MazEF toxin-antitoxin module
MSPGNTRKISGGRLTLIPSLMAQVGMQEGSIVEITVSGNQLILRAVDWEETKKKEKADEDSQR